MSEPWSLKESNQQRTSRERLRCGVADQRQRLNNMMMLIRSQVVNRQAIVKVIISQRQLAVEQTIPTPRHRREIEAFAYSAGKTRKLAGF
jgi:hypothetical protein